MARYETHIKNNIFTYDPTVNEVEQNKYCSFCKRNNYWTKDCYSKQNNSTASNKQKASRASTHNNNKTLNKCSYCLKTNHSIDQCFLKKKNEIKTGKNIQAKAQKPKKANIDEKLPTIIYT